MVVVVVVVVSVVVVGVVGSWEAVDRNTSTYFDIPTAPQLRLLACLVDSTSPLRFTPKASMNAVTAGALPYFFWRMQLS